MHTRDDDLLGRFSGVFESCSEGLDQRVASQRGDGGHVQNAANARPTAANGAFALETSGVSVERGDADQGGQLAMVDLAQFRQLGDERGGEHLADARGALQGVCELFPLIVGVDVIADLAIEFGDLFFERGDDGVDGVQSGLAGGGASAVDLFGPALDELPAAGDQGGEFALDLQAFFKEPGRGELSETRQQMGVDGVCFGQDAQALGEVADVAGIDQSHRHVGFQQGFEQRPFESSGGLDDDACRRDRAELLQKSLDAVGIVGLSPGGLGIGASDVEELFGNIDAHAGSGG